LPVVFRREVVEVCGKTAHDSGQPDQPVSHSVHFSRQLLELCVEAGLLLQEELHRALHLLRRHRLKVHDGNALFQLTTPLSIVGSIPGRATSGPLLRFPTSKPKRVQR
jgi:hypothetical protein